jgi:hypothetical protein
MGERIDRPVCGSGSTSLPRHYRPPTTDSSVNGIVRRASTVAFEGATRSGSRFTPEPGGAARATRSAANGLERYGRSRRGQPGRRPRALDRSDGVCFRDGDGGLARARVLIYGQVASARRHGSVGDPCVSAADTPDVSATEASEQLVVVVGVSDGTPDCSSAPTRWIRPSRRPRARAGVARARPAGSCCTSAPTRALRDLHERHPGDPGLHDVPRVVAHQGDVHGSTTSAPPLRSEARNPGTHPSPFPRSPLTGSTPTSHDYLQFEASYQTSVPDGTPCWSDVEDVGCGPERPCTTPSRGLASPYAPMSTTFGIDSERRTR